MRETRDTISLKESRIPKSGTTSTFFSRCSFKGLKPKISNLRVSNPILIMTKCLIIGAMLDKIAGFKTGITKEEHKVLSERQFVIVDMKSLNSRKINNFNLK